MYEALKCPWFNASEGLQVELLPCSKELFTFFVFFLFFDAKLYALNPSNERFLRCGLRSVVQGGGSSGSKKNSCGGGGGHNI